MGQLFKIKHPEVFQGNLHNKHYFEGWYYKIIDINSETIYAFIIGISLDKITNSSHAFIQFFDALNRVAYYFRYEVQDFHASEKQLEIQIGPNIFTNDHLYVNIDQQNQHIEGTINFTELTPLPKKGIGHGIMGLASYVPYLICRHGIISLNHSLHGSLNVNGIDHDFENGKGYLEKDWGTSFPHAYIWMQCNHYDKEKISLICSVATVPVFGINFDAFFVVLLYEDKVYRFTNYNFNSIKILELEEMHTHFIVSDGPIELDIDAYKTEGVDLPSPVKGSMRATISESLTSKIGIKLYQKKKGQKMLFYEGMGYPAGLEIQASTKDFPLKKK